MIAKQKSIQHVDILCALALFLVFSVCSLILVTIGANNYKGILGEINRGFNTSASLHYVTNKLHSYDMEGYIEISEIMDTKVIILNEDLSSSGYHTIIYCYDGALYELMKLKSQTFIVGNGERLIPVDDFTFSINSDSTIQLIAKDSSSQLMTTTVALKAVKLLREVI